MNVGVIGFFNQRGPVSRLGFVQLSRILQHIAVLDAQIGAFRCQLQRPGIGVRRCGKLARIAQLIALSPVMVDACIGG